jgi:hypothetical protein
MRASGSRERIGLLPLPELSLFWVMMGCGVLRRCVFGRVRWRGVQCGVRARGAEVIDF